jgi:beta-glucanase (GH16 family)
MKTKNVQLPGKPVLLLLIVFLFALTLFLNACGSNGRKGGSAVPAPSATLESGPPTMVTYPSGLTVAFNNEVISGGPRNLVWSDDFDGPALDPSKWFSESGDGSQYGLNGWGNNELQWYLPANVQLAGSRLLINTLEQAQSGYDYTSARIITRDKFAFRYGRIEARIRLPGGQGVWPAFWLMPQDEVYGGWAASGEIDIMEAVNLGGAGGNDIHGTIHYGGSFPGNQSSGQSVTVASSATALFHDYALEWDEQEIRWYLDGILYSSKNVWSSTGQAYPAPFDQPFYILINSAVGGNWPGAPDVSTTFPLTMEVDYVRVYSGD